MGGYSTGLWEPCSENMGARWAPQGVGTVGTEILSPSAEPEAQLEEQVGKTQGGGLGRGPALPTKVCTVSQAGLSLPRRKTGLDAN